MKKTRACLCVPDKTEAECYPEGWPEAEVILRAKLLREAMPTLPSLEREYVCYEWSASFSS